MKNFRRFLSCLLVPLAAMIFGASASGGDGDDKDMQVDARGPLHEGYAQPWQANSTPNQSVDKKPPEPIPEEPAAEKPAGKNVQWIPGYWQWDVDRKDFIWVSGFWRDVPEGRRWIMGYWAQAGDGWRYVNGHWAAEQERDHQYVPEPPKNSDEGPNTAPPDDHSFYIPGTWLYGENGYYFRDGYWSAIRPGFVWVPASYYWTPFGWTFVSGYWDYGLGYRGLLFAPVYFARPYWFTPGWYYQPSFVIGFGGVCGNFFVGVGFGHYFFGDFYASVYLGCGIRPWFWYGAHHFDPLYAHAHWENRAVPGWSAGLQAAYVARVNGAVAPPPRTLAAQATAPAGQMRMVSTLTQTRQSGVQLQPVSQTQQSVQAQSARNMVSASQTMTQSAGLASHNNPQSFHGNTGFPTSGRPPINGPAAPGFHGPPTMGHPWFGPSSAGSHSHTNHGSHH